MLLHRIVPGLVGGQTDRDVLTCAAPAATAGNDHPR